ncbi:MAG: hypothetical protein ACR2LO_00530 [Ilumatobacteraceae bacterium]
MGLCTAAIVIAFLIAESAYRGEEAERAEWIGAAAVLISLPIAMLVYRGFADAADSEAPAIAAVVAIILITGLVSFGLSSGRGGAGMIEAVGLAVVGAGLLSIELSASSELRALIALSSPLAAILAWLVAKGLHDRRSQHLAPVHIGGFRPYDGPPVAGFRPLLHDQPSQPPRRMAPEATWQPPPPPPPAPPGGTPGTT